MCIGALFVIIEQMNRRERKKLEALKKVYEKENEEWQAIVKEIEKFGWKIKEKEEGEE